MHAPNFPNQRFSGFNAATAHFNTCSALLPLPGSAIAEGDAIKTIKAISVVVKSVLSLFITNLLKRANASLRSCPFKLNKRGLNRYLIGRLLDSYLQTYMNNLAMDSVQLSDTKCERSLRVIKIATDVIDIATRYSLA